MKKGDVSACKLACRAVFALGCFVCIQLVGARDARAESPKKVEGFELLGSLGYGVAVRDLSWNDREIDPFGVTVGADFGYTFPFGLRLGTDVGYAFGRRHEYTKWTGEAITTDASSFVWGGSVGYDLMLSSSLRLRGAADGGLLVFFDEGGAPGVFFGPKVALIWQYRAFEFGLQARYMMILPAALHVGLMGGARF
ncbi:MAG TPA: hypothetical protein VFK05_07065 [Polyangiaceae bacterium]|nr:hypothetical protein [Polyangiaceae bacterium]